MKKIFTNEFIEFNKIIFRGFYSTLSYECISSINHGQLMTFS
ncbi:hypothetical protein [Clostridium sp. UBA4548]|nr:hypothetical protein [Clostridium sp. UBA4548]